MTEIYNSLSSCYEKYIKDSNQVQANAKPLDGVFGLHSQAKSHPCHDLFFNEVKDLSAQIAGDASITDVYPYAELILFTPKGHEDELGYWYLYAAQQHAQPLIPKLAPAQAKELLDRYTAEYPKKDWLPVHVKLVKALKKRAKG